eukprot:gene57871-biopygen47988
MQGQHPQARCHARGLSLPVEEQRGGQHDQGRAGEAAGLLFSLHMGQRLRGFAQAHVVSQDAAQALGAQAVQMGTAFLTCPESAIVPAYRQALTQAGPTDTRTTRIFSGRPARGIVNTMMDALRADERSVPPYPVQNALTGALRRMRCQATRSVSRWAAWLQVRRWMLCSAYCLSCQRQAKASSASQFPGRSRCRMLLYGRMLVLMSTRRLTSSG